MVIQCDIVESKPDIVIVNKMKKTAIIISGNVWHGNIWGQGYNWQGK